MTPTEGTLAPLFMVLIACIFLVALERTRMKKTTVTLSLKERYTVGILAKQLHTTRSCVMHKALHVYAKALRYQKRRDKKSHLRTFDFGKKR